MIVEPVATYRVQLNPDFGFSDSASIAQYLAELGVSHFYASPMLQAAEGSLSGYDVVDPSIVSEALGGVSGHATFVAALRQAGLGLMADIVPNHLAISDSSNPWWRDVLENGAASRYATYFDVDWEASAERDANKVLLPVLDDHFGRVLDEGKIRLVFSGSVFEIEYESRRFPMDPVDYAEVLAPAARATDSDQLGFIADTFAVLPRPAGSLGRDAIKRHRDKAQLSDLLRELCQESPAVEAAIQKETRRINESQEALARLIEMQNYRLAFWRVAESDLGYRRFFNINDLIGLRVEKREVFRDSHRLPVEWVIGGAVDALRVDHPDGLRDPTQYFQRLREACPKAWIVVEKILEPNETLRADWPVEGTTGYDFLNQCMGLFVDPEAESALTVFYHTFSGEQQTWEEVAAQSKRESLTLLLMSELNRLASLLQRICGRNRRHRDYTSRTLLDALTSVAASFPVYRTYAQVGAESVDTVDAGYIDSALAATANSNSELDPELVAFLRSILLQEVAGDEEAEFVMRFQQLTGPAMAKGLEDTAFYRYHRFIALNEVGGDPGRFGFDAAAFHEACRERAEHWPYSLLATSTHDTKRSEDVRARLCVLSEIPEGWAQACQSWRVLNQGLEAAGTIDGNTEYLFYQSLVGAWPISVERIEAFMEKAGREAKRQTSWSKPDESYEAGWRQFTRAAMGHDAFIAAVEEFVLRVREAGWMNSLSQTLCKLTAPGVPDLYQGCELWDLSLVDPDNRRPVDFEMRSRLLDEMEGWEARDAMQRFEDGAVKLWLTKKVLAARRARPAAFGAGSSYEPMHAAGEKSSHVIAYCRGEQAIAVMGRFFQELKGEWSDTTLTLPKGRWRNVLLGDNSVTGSVSMDSLLGGLPAGLLVRA